MNGAQGVEQVQIRWSDGSGWSYRHLDQHDNLIESSTDALPKLHVERFTTPADRSSLIHEAAQVWPGVRIVDATTP